MASSSDMQDTATMQETVANVVKAEICEGGGG